ncbi:ATP-binding protein [Defluviimonas sp. WL0002]|uniref:histidine kinase n=1 Tax=Albidovulum marisflavi TaxID=2984159 RepID=A0ABT2Z981_9RHOB|nr:histidine kinase dimerization/phospho-acceptor domain-containing protein [Defluviimonas sp. WL0002]MCV2867690.1 ATP-binding protein [Defluviimonas sp. WL0002]
MTGSFRPWSLRRKLTLRVLWLVLGGWLATIALSALVLDHEMNEMFDEELRALVETTVLYLDTAQGGRIPRTIGVQTNDGERVLRILSPEGTGATAPWPELISDGFHDAPGWRILRRSAEGAVIEAAHSTGWRREEVIEAASAFLMLALPLVLLIVWGLRRTVSEATAPVARLAGSVSGRNPDDLSPVAADGLPKELRPLAEAFNGYLARIGQLRQAEKDFVANAAHELRTPLAALRGRLELSSDADTVAAVETIDALTRRLERLLQLARLDAGVGLGRGPSDLVRIIGLLIDELRPFASHPIRFDDGDLDGLTVAADADAIAILLRNLIENALQHGTGEVRLRLSPNGIVSIENPSLRDALPEGRFDRGRGSSGLGLGLSIVEALAKAMGVQVSRTVGQGAVRFELRFPLPPGA